MGKRRVGLGQYLCISLSRVYERKDSTSILAVQKNNIPPFFSDLAVYFDILSGSMGIVTEDGGLSGSRISNFNASFSIILKGAFFGPVLS